MQDKNNYVLIVTRRKSAMKLKTQFHKRFGHTRYTNALSCFSKNVADYNRYMPRSRHVINSTTVGISVTFTLN